MNVYVALALVIGIGAWIGGWTLALQYVDGLRAALQDVVGAFVVITTGAVVLGMATYVASRRYL